MTQTHSAASRPHARCALGLLGLLGGTLASIMLASCGALSTEPREFTIAIDSITTPEQTRADVALTVRLWGAVGPSGCFQFHRAEVSKSGAQATVTAIGQEKRGIGIACTMMPVALAGESVVISPPFSDPFEIRVRTRDGQWISRTVRVE